MVRKRVAAITPLLGKGSNARECRSGGPTHDIELNPDRVALALCGIAVLLEYLLRRKLGIDELPFVDSEGRAAGMPHPGRFTPTVAVCFLVVTAALLMLDRGTKWRWRPSELLALPILIAPTMSLIG